MTKCWPTILFGILSPFTLTLRADNANDFFEQKIRPVLVEHCYACHSTQTKKIKGGLRLDDREHLRKGGASGPAIVPGQPNESLLIQALRYDKLQMPPKRKLPDAVIADFAHWVTIGAPDPRTAHAASKAAAIDFPNARRHWAYQPLRRSAPPAVNDNPWLATPIDGFILAKLETNNLSPSPAADRRTLIRRAYFDLIGLPPSFAEVEAFAHDSAPDAFARIVDRLLASPHYGERWGRHWLDVARYADTKDLVLLYGKDRIRPYAYTYRDYVVQAFNADTPYNQFILEQLAADQLAPKVEPWRLAALGFLTLGRLFDNNLHDIYDDQIDTVTRGLLGLTVSCARCHDHKYDAVAMTDYYALYGVFASCESPVDLPRIEPMESAPASVPAAQFEKQLAEKRARLEQHVNRQYAYLTENVRNRVADYMVKALTEKPDPLEEAVFFMSLAPDQLRPPIVARWRRYIERRAQPDDPVFAPLRELLALADASFKQASHAIVTRWRSQPPGLARGQINPIIQEALIGPFASRADAIRMYGGVLKRVYDESKQATFIATPSQRQLLEILTGADSPTYFPKSNTYLYMSRVERDAYGGMVTDLDKVAVYAPAAPPRAMVLADAADLYQPRIFLRGNPGQPGPAVSRRFLQILTESEPAPFTHGSGRLDLAQAIASADNPLTSRVLVNRVWMHHFGEPLVATPSDFGTRSNPPSHPELLDFLAADFMAHGWSLKHLHRQILLSRTYQQASADRPACRKMDPDNRLLWRAHRRRLDLETMRDSLLAISGRLDVSFGGRPVDVAGDPLNRRRTLYGLVDRQDVPGLFRAFDFAVPDQSVERRPQTIAPQQALFALNSPFVIEQAKALAELPEVSGLSISEDRVSALYRRVLARLPNTEEVQLALQFIYGAQLEPTNPTQQPLSPWAQYAQVLLLTNELMFVD